MPEKLRIGWYSFSCCEDSTIVFTEMLNEHYKDWFHVLDFKSARVIKGKNVDTDLDVAFVEGAIASPDQAREVREIRKQCKKLVAIGACAVNGMPSAQRNEFDEGRKKEIQALVEHFKMAERVQPLHEIVKVDAQVPGCPMDERMFLQVLDSLLLEFGVPHARP